MSRPSGPKTDLYAKLEHEKGKKSRIKTHLNRKLILVSTYEIPSSIEDNRNSLTYALNIGVNLITSYPRNPPSTIPKEKTSEDPAYLGNAKRRLEFFPNLRRSRQHEHPSKSHNGNTFVTVLCVPYASAGSMLVEAKYHLSNPCGPPSSGENLSLATFTGIHPPS